jgi:hypothetical protein
VNGRSWGFNVSEDLNPETGEISLNLDLNSKTGEKPRIGRSYSHRSGHATARVKPTLSAGFGVGDANPSRAGMKFAG